MSIIGELDGLVVSDHPFADPETGAAHACGHNAQIGMMLGATIGLHSPNVLRELSGSIAPFAAPAEEFVEVEQRMAMREEGKLEFWEESRSLFGWALRRRGHGDNVSYRQ